VGEDAELASLESRAQREGLTNVRFLGALPRERMREVYATSDACIVPLRRSELFTSVIPSKIFEILAMERPLILSVDGEARTLVERSGGGVFAPPEDVDAMQKALEDLVASPEKRLAMGRAGREHVIREFDRKALAERYLGILEGVARKRA
jgi:glycosyltransferase involved in cell wall biosynthesis